LFVLSAVLADEAVFVMKLVGSMVVEDGFGSPLILK